MNQPQTDPVADGHAQQAVVETATADTDASAPAPAVSALQKKQQTWAALPYDSTQLLRLAPLAAERETGLRPLLFASLSRVSRHSKELSMLRLVIVLPEQKVDKAVNHLEVWVDHKEKEIRILPEHGLVTRPGNRGLGRLLLAQAIGWCSPAWNDYRINSVDLMTKHADSELARLRRDHALQAQGFTVTYNDAVKMSATCSAIRLKQLGRDWNHEKVRIMDHLEVAHMLFSCDQNLKAQASQLNKLQERIDLLKRDDNTLRFTIFTLVFFAVFQAGLLIWMATR